MTQSIQILGISKEEFFNRTRKAYIEVSGSNVRKPSVINELLVLQLFGNKVEGHNEHTLHTLFAESSPQQNKSGTPEFSDQMFLVSFSVHTDSSRFNHEHTFKRVCMAQNLDTVLIQSLHSSYVPLLNKMGFANLRKDMVTAKAPLESRMIEEFEQSGGNDGKYTDYLTYRAAIINELGSAQAMVDYLLKLLSPVEVVSFLSDAFTSSQSRFECESVEYSTGQSSEANKPQETEYSPCSLCGETEDGESGFSFPTNDTGEYVVCQNCGCRTLESNWNNPFALSVDMEGKVDYKTVKDVFGLPQPLRTSAIRHLAFCYLSDYATESLDDVNYALSSMEERVTGKVKQYTSIKELISSYDDVFRLVYIKEKIIDGKIAQGEYELPPVLEI